MEPGSRVLDLGCGRGTLLKMLVDKKQVRGTGVEISEERVYDAVEKGLSVYHGDIDEGLSDYPDGMFDYVILNQTLQQARETVLVMHEALRVGRYIVVSFPNFAHWRARLQLLLRGRRRSPRRCRTSGTTRRTSTAWRSGTSKCSCGQQGMTVVRSFFIGRRGRVRLWPNLLAEHGVFVLEAGVGYNDLRKARAHSSVG